MERTAGRLKRIVMISGQEAARIVSRKLFAEFCSQDSDGSAADVDPFIADPNAYYAAAS